jgi:hypothetical protein
VQLLLRVEIVEMANVHGFFGLRIGWLGGSHGLSLSKSILKQVQTW